MTHPYGDIRQHKVERARVPSITKGYASGGAVSADAPVNRKSGGRTAGKHLKLSLDGGVAKMRNDRPGRAKGGRAPKAKTNVNVIIAPQGGGPTSPAGGPAGPAGLPPMPPRPTAPLAGPPMPPPGMAPPGMPPRSMGGRAYKDGGGVANYANTEKYVRHSPNKKDGRDIGRGKVITYKTGGAVFASPTGQHGPKFGGGGGGGTARLQEAKRAARLYAKPAGGK